MSAGPLCRPLVLRSDSVSSSFSVYRTRKTLLTSNPEFTREYESPITDYSDSAPVPAPVMARKVDGFHLQARKFSLAKLFKGFAKFVGDAVKKVASEL